ncbi:MAG: hypothetical protein AUJ88_06265 [Gallionellaceae bacterium CG1_02_56_997]|nr:MAG: hypothetical protein AUJ88_06265 [Gallionellaceae bacterium CG1_02_56_997]
MEKLAVDSFDQLNQGVNMSDKKADNAPARRKIDFSNPFIVKQVTLNTTPALMAYETAFDACAMSLRNLSTIVPSITKNQSDMMAVNGAVEHLLNNAFANIRKESARIKKIADDNGIEMGKLSYTNAKSADAKLTCAKAGQYLQLIVELDELICLVHSAWFAGFIADDAKSSLERLWRRKTIGIASEVKSITNRAFKAAKQTESEANKADLDADNDLLGDNPDEPATETAPAKPKAKRAKSKAAAEETPATTLPTEAEALAVD